MPEGSTKRPPGVVEMGTFPREKCVVTVPPRKVLGKSHGSGRPLCSIGQRAQNRALMQLIWFAIRILLFLKSYAVCGVFDCLVQCRLARLRESVFSVMGWRENIVRVRPAPLTNRLFCAKVHILG